MKKIEQKPLSIKFHPKQVTFCIQSDVSSRSLLDLKPIELLNHSDSSDSSNRFEVFGQVRKWPNFTCQVRSSSITSVNIPTSNISQYTGSDYYNGKEVFISITACWLQLHSNWENDLFTVNTSVIGHSETNI